MNKPAAIPLSAKRIDYFTPPSLEGTDKEVRFGIRIPTPSERDVIGTRLFELGMTSVTQETIRATMVDELYKLDWGKGSDDANEAYGDELAGRLDSYWSRQAIEEEAQRQWQEQEVQRLLDQAAGSPEREAAPRPATLIRIREHSEIKLLIDDIMNRSQRVRALASSQMNFGRLNSVLMARLHLLTYGPTDPAAWPADVTLERDETGLATMDSIDALREHIGDEAWRELVNRIDTHYGLGEEERKNSDSPLERQSDQTGSHEQSGASESSDGKSMGSSTGAIPTEGSETTTGKSSESPSAKEGRSKKAGQTAGVS